MTPTAPLPDNRSSHSAPTPAAFAVAGGLILLACAAALTAHVRNLHLVITAFCVALAFATAVLALRAATLAAAACGMLIAFITAVTTGVAGFTALTVLFVITWTSTRAGRERKRRLGTAESRHGRKASQVLANLGIFAFLAAASLVWPHRGYSTLLLAGAAAALAEAAGDTAASELGQIFGGTPYLITRLSRVPIGTDGGITLAGTLAGCSAVVLVLASWALASHALPVWGFIAAIAAVAGIMFDSLLGATLERRGWLNNDGVNFLSTLFAAVMAMTGCYLYVII
jgi:uncharacterized protein (TIGR00297 family)